MEILAKISDALQQGDDIKVSELTKQAIQQNISLNEILNNGLITGMDVIGRQFKNREIFLPEVLMAAKAMYAGMEILKPLMIKEGIPSVGKVVLGTVRGDLHDIGKNLVGIMLRGAGFDVIDLGKGISPENFIEVAQNEGAKVIGMSALLTTTMPVMKEVVNLLREKGLDDSIKTIIGGAPVNEEYARHIGADAYAYDASKAVETVKNLIRVE